MKSYKEQLKIFENDIFEDTEYVSIHEENILYSLIKNLIEPLYDSINTIENKLDILEDDIHKLIRGDEY